MATFDAVKLLAPGGIALLAHAGNGQAPVMVLQLHVVPGEAWQLHQDDETVRGFEEVHRRGPAWRPRGKSRHPRLGGQQILERIPPYESHGRIVPLSTSNSQSPTRKGRSRARNPGPRRQEPEPERTLVLRSTGSADEIYG